MSTAADIISKWPSAEHFAADLGLKYRSHGRLMKMRGRIPTRYWDAVVSAAARRNIGITRADLEAVHAAASQAAA